MNLIKNAVQILLFLRALADLNSWNHYLNCGLSYLVAIYFPHLALFQLPFTDPGSALDYDPGFDKSGYNEDLILYLYV